MISASGAASAALFTALIAAAIGLYGAEILDWARSIDPELFTPKAAG